MSISYDKYTGRVVGDVNEYVFEEEVKRLLKEKGIEFISKEELMNLFDDTDLTIQDKYKIILNTLSTVPVKQKHNATVAKNVLTVKGKLNVHNEKILYFDNSSASNTDDKKLLVNDPRKNPITLSKLIKPNGTSMTPLFRIYTDKSIERNLGKLLVELRISTPLSNFKGYITSGLLEKEYGIGFFSEYNKNLSKNPFFIVCHKNTDTPEGAVEISIVRLPHESDEEDYIPTNFQISPLVHGLGDNDELLELYNSLTDTIPFVEDNSYIYGIGDLRDEGHGPIDCKIAEFDFYEPDFSTCKTIFPKYYPGNSGRIKCETNISDSKTKSKLFNLRVQPSSYENGDDSISNAHILKPPFGDSNFDMYNLLKSIFDFSNLKPYKCFGNIIINNIIVPVIGFIMDFNLGRVTFTISPYFSIPEALKDIEGIDSEFRGKRLPLIVFNTNINSSHTYKNNGFIGDGNDDQKFKLGFDSHSKAYKSNAPYKLSLIDIIIEIRDFEGSICKSRVGETFRYSGDFNKYNFDFSKHDYDSYPYPAEERDISDRIESLSEIPSLNPEPMIIATTDNKFVFAWIDDADSYISFSNNSEND